MFSYVYMKILESQPSRYDRGISWLSLGQSARIKRRIVEEHVTAGLRMLDVGCGTGTLAVLAARQGARVTAFDVSPGMLAVARRKIAAASLAEKIELRRMGLGRMDHLPAASFDLLTATLVFSELSADEQDYLLHHAHRLLAGGGRLALADETTPEGFVGRLLHAAVRLPLLLLTFALTQTTTRAVAGLEGRVARAGFRIEKAERSRMGSFLYLVAVKEES